LRKPFQYDYKSLFDSVEK